MHSNSEACQNHCLLDGFDSSVEHRAKNRCKREKPPCACHFFELERRIHTKCHASPWQSAQNNNHFRANLYINDLSNFDWPTRKHAQGEGKGVMKYCADVLCERNGMNQTVVLTSWGLILSDMPVKPWRSL